MALVYFLMFGAFGTMGPYQALYYKHMGLSGIQTSLLMAMMPTLLFISQPLFGPLTDRSGHRGRMLSYMLLAVGGTGLLLGAGTSFLTLLPAVMLWGFFWGPMVPIADSVALGEAVRTGSSFPMIRLWGSIGFLIVTVLAGRLWTVVDLRWAFPAYALLNVVAWQFARRLPAEAAATRKPNFRELGRLLRDPLLLGLLLASGLIQAANASHAIFFTVHMASVGGSSGTAGLGWGFSALMEVPVMMVLGRLTRRTGPLPLLAFGSAMYALRWYLVSLATSPGMLVGLQGLQGLTMAIFMPTAVILIGELLPDELRTTGQSVLGLVNGGIATLLGTLAAGRMVDMAGTAGLYRMISYVAAAGAVVCIVLLLSRRAGGQRMAAVSNLEQRQGAA